MIRLVIHLLMALDVVLVVWGQVTYSPVIPTFPPPPTSTPVINGSVRVLIGKSVLVGQDERVTIDCGNLTNETIRNLTNEVIRNLTKFNETIHNVTVTPVVTWCKDGREISNDTVTNVIISADNRFCIITETLMSVGGQLGTDGDYTCKVCANNTCINVTSSVKVCNPPHFTPPTVDPVVIPGFIALTCGQDAIVESLTGATLSFACAVFNGSDFTLELYKDGSLISNTLSYSFPASDDDFGTYTFRILNKCGEDTAVTRILRQGDPPDIDEGPFIPVPDSVPPGDVTVKIGSPVYVISGYNVTIICNILTGTPPVTIIWLRNGMPEDPPRGNVTTITVTDATHGDVFTCRADNNIGYDNESTTIFELVTVRFASSTGTVSEGDGTVTITIEKVGNAAIPVMVAVITSDGTATAGSDYGTDGDSNPPVITPITIPAGQSSVDIQVPIIDDNCREDDKTFNGYLTVLPSQNVILGTPNQTVITIEDDDVSTVEFLNAPYTVVEGSGMAYNVCLSITPACDLQAEIELITAPKDALPNVDYDPVTVTVNFDPNQMVSCVEMNNTIDDNIAEDDECFSLVIVVPPGSSLVPGENANVTIISIEIDGPTQLYNDTVVGDPLYEVPLNMISNETFPEVTSLCYEIRGEAGKIFSLISDGCVQVNANYSAMDIPENGNIISQIGVFAYDTADQCINILVDVNDCIPVVNGVAYSGDPGYNMSGVTARRRNNRVRITVPNCDGNLDDLVFWVVCQNIMGQRMIKFQVLRGSGLQPDSHGLIGQFWNIPVTASPITPQPDNFNNAYNITVDPPQSTERTFTAELYHRTWDFTLKPCLYAGSSQGGPIYEVNSDHSVIEGVYFEYEVSGGIFGTSDKYNHLDPRQCSNTAN